MTEAALDPALHHPVRIRILTRLMVHEALRFTALQKATGLTPGNLGSQLAYLEKVGYVASWEAIVSLRPGRLVKVTDDGRTAFKAYVAAVDRLAAELRGVVETPSAARGVVPAPRSA